MNVLKHVALAAALLLALTACGGGAPTAAEVQGLITKGCGVAVTAGSIAAVIAAKVSPGSGPTISGANAIAKAVCDQWNAKQSMKSLTDDGCVAVVNGVCVRKEK